MDQVWKWLGSFWFTFHWLELSLLATPVQERLRDVVQLFSQEEETNLFGEHLASLCPLPHSLRHTYTNPDCFQGCLMIKSKVLKWILHTLEKTSTNWVSVTSRRRFILATSRFSVLGIPKITTPRFSNSLGGLTGHSMLLYLGLMIYYSKRIQGKISKGESPEETSASSSGITQDTIPPAKNCDNTFV